MKTTYEFLLDTAARIEEDARDIALKEMKGKETKLTMVEWLDKLAQIGDLLKARNDCNHMAAALTFLHMEDLILQGEALQDFIAMHSELTPEQREDVLNGYLFDGKDA